MAGIVEEVSSAVTAIRPGKFVVGSFSASDNTCEIGRAGYQSSFIHREPAAPDGAQAERLRVPPADGTLADGTLVASPDIPSDDLIPSLLAASDVLGTGWFDAVAAEAGQARRWLSLATAHGLLGVLAAKQLAAERIIAMSRHQPRQKLAPSRAGSPSMRVGSDRGRQARKALVTGLRSAGGCGAVTGGVVPGTYVPRPLRGYTAA